MSIEAPRTASPAPSLRDALRRARTESAEKSGVLVELRTAETARLDLLKEAIEPVLDQIPEDIDLFESAIMPGEPARLFLDQLGFVEMAEDKRTYRFWQDTRYGRILIAQSDKLPVIVDAMTDYVARRMIEREKALVSDSFAPAAPAAAKPTEPAATPKPAARSGATTIWTVIVAIVVIIGVFVVADLWDYALRG
jgi:hypothetical protein